jgi:hypothetical protein
MLGWEEMVFFCGVHLSSVVSILGMQKRSTAVHWSQASAAQSDSSGRMGSLYNPPDSFPPHTLGPTSSCFLPATINLDAVLAPWLQLVSTRKRNPIRLISSRVTSWRAIPSRLLPPEPTLRDMLGPFSAPRIENGTRKGRGNYYSN